MYLGTSGKVSYLNWVIKTLYKITHAIVISSVASLTSFRTFNDSPEVATERLNKARAEFINGVKLKLKSKSVDPMMTCNCAVVSSNEVNVLRYCT